MPVDSPLSRLSLLRSPVSLSPRTPGNATDAINPHSPRYGHPYRHGVHPTRETHEKMKAWEAANRGVARPADAEHKERGSVGATQPAIAAAATGPETLSFGGGVRFDRRDQRRAQGVPGVLGYAMGHGGNELQRLRDIHGRPEQRCALYSGLDQGSGHQWRALVGRDDSVLRWIAGCGWRHVLSEWSAARGLPERRPGRHLV